MGAVFGLIGEGSLDEVRSMGAKMPHRGAYLRVWSPIPGVYFGERSHKPPQRSEEGVLAIDCQLEEWWMSAWVEARQIPKGSDVDPAAILEALLREYGVEGLNQVRGYFSLAYWNESDRSLLLGCDHVGYKSLCYAQLPNRLAFASEYKALLALDDIIAEPDRDALQFYHAAREKPKGRPYLRDVASLPSGAAVYWKSGVHEVRLYWIPRTGFVNRSFDGHARALREALLSITERQCGPYQRIGLQLGAGIDAAALLAAIRYVKPDAVVASYTIGFGEDDPEILGARAVAEHFGTEHSELHFRPEVLPEALPRLVWLMEDCTGREEALLKLLNVTEAGKRECVVMAGYGPDMLFGGMPRHRLVRLAERLPGLRDPLTELFHLTQTGKAPQSLLGRLFGYMVYRGSDTPPPSVIGASGPAEVQNPGGIDEFLGQNPFPYTTFGYMEPIYETASVEFRSPCLDSDFVDLARAIPGRFKVGWLQQKIVFREALRPLLPPAILWRKKAIQRVRHDARLSDILDTMADELLSPSTVRRRGLIDPMYVTSLRRRRGGSAYSTEQLYRVWTLISMEIWARQFLDRRGEPWGFEVPEDWVNCLHSSH